MGTFSDGNNNHRATNTMNKIGNHISNTLTAINILSM